GGRDPGRARRRDPSRRRGAQARRRRSTKGTAGDVGPRERARRPREIEPAPAAGAAGGKAVGDPRGREARTVRDLVATSRAPARSLRQRVRRESLHRAGHDSWLADVPTNRYPDQVTRIACYTYSAMMDTTAIHAPPSTRTPLA